MNNGLNFLMNSDTRSPHPDPHTRHVACKSSLGCFVYTKLEDLKVLRRSPDLFNYVEIGQGQLQLIIKHILFYHIWGLQPFWSSDLKQSNEYSIKQPSDI